MNRWSTHPHVRSDSALTRGERAADVMRNSMGSWAFVFSALIFLAIWMLYNRNSGFDKYPFILLNLVLSCLAAMQGAILLIAAKRADQIASELANSDHQIDADTLVAVTEIRALTLQVHDLTKEVHRLSETIYQHVSHEAPASGGDLPQK